MLPDAGTAGACPTCGSQFVVPNPTPSSESSGLGSAGPQRNRPFIPIVVGAAILVIALAALALYTSGRFGIRKLQSLTVPIKAKPKTSLTLTITSTETKQSHTYQVGTDTKTLSAQSGFQLLFVTLTIKNETDAQKQFSSERFHVLDKGGKEMSANLIGVGGTFAEAGRLNNFKGETQNSKHEVMATYNGKLSTSVSFCEWNLMPRQTYSETLVFVIPMTVEGAHCEFQDADK